MLYGPYGDDLNLGMHFTTRTTNATYVEPAVMYRVAQMSNFNVILQSRHCADRPVTEIGVFCKFCNVREIIQDQFISIFDDSFWVKIEKFCNNHQHKPTAKVEESNNGRKFRLDE